MDTKPEGPDFHVYETREVFDRLKAGAGRRATFLDFPIVYSDRLPQGEVRFVQLTEASARRYFAGETEPDALTLPGVDPRNT